VGLSVSLEQEDGTPVDTVHDPSNLLHRVLPSPEDTSFQWVTTIDWYGDTVFNRVQAAKARCEWQRLVGSCREPEALALLQRIDGLFERCASEVHLYVKFCGD